MGGQTDDVIVRFFRTGGLPPSEDERVVTVDDGRYAVWRSTNVEAAGSFAGTLPAEEAQRIQALAADCVAAGSLFEPPVPDSAVDSIELEGADLQVGQRDRPTEPWGDLLDVLRELLEKTDEPHAAVALEVAADGRTVSLRQRGPSATRLDLSELVVRATRQRPGGQREQLAVESPPSDGDVEAEPGWSLELQLEPADIEAAETIVAHAVLHAFERERRVAITLLAVREPTAGQ